MNKESWLSKLYYEIGKQSTDFRLTYNFEKDGEKLFAKWKAYLSCDEKIIKKSTHREILKNEIVFDYDKETEGYKKLIERFEEEDIKFYAYATDSWRAKHIHTFWNGLIQLKKGEREKIRELIISKYGCDLALKSDKHMIPIEYCPHWKTNEIKKLILVKDGVNDAQPYLQQLIDEEKNQKKSTQFSNLLIDNYTKNVEQFYEQQPFFYDKSGIFWFWKKDRYEQVDDTDIMNQLDDALGFFGQTVNSKLKSHYLEAFKRIGRKNIPKKSPVKWIQFKNKAFSISSGKMYDVEPNFFFTNPIPWDFGETDETPIMDKLFKEWVGEDMVPVLYELLAYCCYTDYPIQLLFCLIGGGRNGKGCFLKILDKFIGKENVTSTSLDLITGNGKSRFESFKLYKKLVALMGETNFGLLSSTSLLKQLTGGDKIGYEKKGKDPFDDYNYAKIIIASNSLPTTQDTSDGFFRRWFIIDFANEFPEGKDITKTIPNKEYNNLALKVTKILPKLIENGKFTNQGAIEERKQKYISSSNPLPLFLSSCCNLGEDLFISYNELYTAYVYYLKKHKKRRVKSKEFKAALEDEGFWGDKTSKQISTDEKGYPINKVLFWVDGINLKSTWKDEIFARFAPFTKIPTPLPIGGVNRKHEQNEQNEQQTEIWEELIDEIHIKCAVCGNNPSHFYYNSKYYCSEDCIKQIMAQKG